jgi:hypothetical protein
MSKPAAPEADEELQLVRKPNPRVIMDNTQITFRGEGISCFSPHETKINFEIIWVIDRPVERYLTDEDIGIIAYGSTIREAKNYLKRVTNYHPRF